jgi:dihydroorotase
MMQLIKQATIVDSNSKYNNTVQDILIEDGEIVQIAPSIEQDGADIIEHEHLHLSIAFTDLMANFGEPGSEEKETLESGSKAALAGGFAHVCISPATMPCIQTKSQVEFLMNQSSKHGVRFLPIGAATHNLEGKKMNELFDMYQSGAVAFSNHKHSIQNAQLLTSLLQYTSNFGAKLFHYACDENLNYKTISHEGTSSVHLGFKGQPAIAEEVIVARDIAICKHYNLPIHFSTISTAGSVQLIREAKQAGLEITCDVAAHQLLFLDEDLSSFDTKLKVLPPFRDSAHQEALIEGLIDGTIDAICSDHEPQNLEHKMVEFDQAAAGISSIETAFAFAHTALKNRMALDVLIQKFTSSPVSIIDGVVDSIDLGCKSKYVLYNPNASVVFDALNMKSKSKNNPAHLRHLQGVIYQVV